MKNTLRIIETFSSIQGESTHAGRLCFFIRLAGCNLNCNYCDTVYAQKQEEGNDFTIDELLDSAVESGLKLVEITGGEPLYQEATSKLCEVLLANGFTVLVETNGSLPLSVLPEKVIKIMDCKLPSSGEAMSLDPENFSFIGKNDEIKFVIADSGDYRYALDLIEKFKLNEKTANLIFGPAWGSLNPDKLVEWMLKDKVPARLQLQLHKYIWGPEKQGV
jgi:7-carboxy-7-deazaguanine synthase